MGSGLPGRGADPPPDRRAVRRAFASCGFRREALFPCYGLAEATLMVSGGPRQDPPVILHIKADSLARNQVEVGPPEDATCRIMVGCGENLRGQRIVVVDPQTRLAVADGHVGEIWVQGPSVAGGYYEDPEATAATFQARRPGPDERGEGPFLRTGDLGFLLEGQLFVTGRLKNLIIIRGRNHYPEDIEQTINSAYEGLRLGYCAAFSIEVEDHDQLVVVQEVEPRHRDLDADAAIRHPHGDCHPARTGCLCGHPGQGRHGPQDLQRQDAAGRLPRTVSARPVGSPRGLEDA